MCAIRAERTRKAQGEEESDEAEPSTHAPLTARTSSLSFDPPEPRLLVQAMLHGGGLEMPERNGACCCTWICGVLASPRRLVVVVAAASCLDIHPSPAVRRQPARAPAPRVPSTHSTSGPHMPTRWPPAWAACSRSWTFSLTAKYFATHLWGKWGRVSMRGVRSHERERGGLTDRRRRSRPC